MKSLNQDRKLNNILGQERVLPREMLNKWNKITQGDLLQFYALADLGKNLEFQKNWILLGKKFLVVLEVDQDKTKRDTILGFQVFHLKEVSKLVITDMRGLGILKVFWKPLDRPQEFFFSRRQEQFFYTLVSRFKERKQVISQCENHEGHVGHEKNHYQERSLEQVHQDYDEKLRQNLNTDFLLNEKGSRKIVWRLLAYLLPYKSYLIWGSIGMVFMTVFSLIPPFISGRLIDTVIRPYEMGSLSLVDAQKLGVFLLGGLVATYLFKEFFTWMRLRTMSVLGEFVASDLRKELFTHLQKLGLDFYASKQTGSIISRVSSDTDRIWDFVAVGVVELVISVMLLMGLGIFLIGLDLKLGLIIVLPIPFYLGMIFYHGEILRKIFLKAFRKWSDVTDVLADSIPGIKVVKSFNNESYERARFFKTNQSVTKEFNNIHLSWTRFWPVLMVAIHALTSIVWYLALTRIINTESDLETLTAGTFVSILLYLTMFIQPIEIIGQMSRMLNRATSSAYRIFEILDTRPSDMETRKDASKISLKGNIEFQNVSFSYDGVREVLKGVSFRVEKGEMIGLVGSSGSGKSTLMNLLTGFYEPTKGKIFFDGHELSQLDVGHLRRQIGVVLQDSYLFHGTILENIRYGKQDARFTEIVEAAKVANAHEFILSLPLGYDTVVGEKGHTLSGGERQRIAIARAILLDPPLLILDEATSSVDTETEYKIQKAIDHLSRGRTVLAIAHRLSTLKKAHKIVAFHKGKVKEIGSHQELLQKEKGLYKKLFDLQVKVMNH